MMEIVNEEIIFAQADKAAECKGSVAVLFGEFCLNNVKPLKTRDLIFVFRK